MVTDMSSHDTRTSSWNKTQQHKDWPDFRLGITGTIAGGKSTVCNLLKEKGLPIIDTDQLAREVISPGTNNLQKLVGIFGQAILLEDGAVDRKIMLNKILASREDRKRVEDILHPAIFARMSDWLCEQKSQGNEIVAVEVPLLFERGWDRFFNLTLTVLTPVSTALQRLHRKRGLAQETARQLLDLQMKNEQKAHLADYVIRNDGTKEELKKKVDEFWCWLQQKTTGSQDDSFEL